MKQKLFLSWSEDRSKIIATQLHKWIPEILQNVSPFISTEISKGSRGMETIDTELEGTHFGILCLTPENLESTWIHFEAGALSKMAGKSKVIPLLFELKPSDIKPPLSRFQMAELNREQLFKLIQSINGSLDSDSALAELRLQNAFDRVFPDFEKELNEAIKTVPRATATFPAKSSATEDKVSTILEEVLANSRMLVSRAENPRIHTAPLANESPRETQPFTYEAFSQDDIITAFSRFPDFDRKDTQNEIHKVEDYLVRGGIKSRMDLYRMVDSKAIFDWLRDVYRKELLRNRQYPLDPVAVAVWGSLLYSADMAHYVQVALVERLRTSPEYRKAHSDKTGGQEESKRDRTLQ